MKVSAEEVKKIALLSRLEIKEDRVEAVQQQLSDILSYMELIEPSFLLIIVINGLLYHNFYSFGNVLSL